MADIDSAMSILERRVLHVWRDIVARLAPFLALAVVLAPSVACVKCDYSTSHGICVSNGETNAPDRAEVERVIDETVLIWSQHYPLADVAESLRWVWIQFIDDEFGVIDGGVLVRGFSSGRWVGVYDSGDKWLNMGVLKHELGHVVLLYAADLTHRDVREQERLHHCKFHELGLEQWPGACK